MASGYKYECSGNILTNSSISIKFQDDGKSLSSSLQTFFNSTYNRKYLYSINWNFNMKREDLGSKWSDSLIFRKDHTYHKFSGDMSISFYLNGTKHGIVLK